MAEPNISTQQSSYDGAYPLVRFPWLWIRIPRHPYQLRKELSTLWCTFFSHSLITESQQSLLVTTTVSMQLKAAHTTHAAHVTQARIINRAYQYSQTSLLAFSYPFLSFLSRKITIFSCLYLSQRCHITFVSLLSAMILVCCYLAKISVGQDALLNIPLARGLNE